MKRMSSLALRECCSSIFLCVSVALCIRRRVIHSQFLHSSLLPCNWLFSRHQTFLAEDTKVCRVVMDMLGIRLHSLVPYCCGCVSLRWCIWFFFFLVLDYLCASYTCRLVALELISGLVGLICSGPFFLFGSVLFF